jgi:hypothetical protein
MDDDYREENKYKIQKGSKKRGRNIYQVSTEYLKNETKPKDKQTKQKEKVYKDPFAARKAADDEDRQNLKETRAVEAKGMNHGGEAVVQGVGIAIKGTGFKGVF